MSTNSNQPTSSCYGISACNTLSVFIECLAQIYQGTDASIEMLLSDEEGQPIDINQILEMYISLYGDKYGYLEYVYPDTTGYLPINIIQTVEDNEVVDQGIISIDIPASETVKFMTGGLFAEIKIKMIDTNYPGGFRTKVIACLNIGTIKLSNTKDIQL